jgi:hypothetical protein
MTHKNKISYIDIGFAVRQKMTEQGITISWLAKQVECDRGNLYKQLHNRHIYPELLFKISIALETDFFMCYSDCVMKFLKTSIENPRSATLH